MELTMASSTHSGERLLRRSVEGKMIAGVAGGLSRYFDIDVVVARIGLVALALMGVGVPLYLAAWLLVPDERSDLSVADHVFGHYRTDVIHQDRHGADTAFEGGGHVL